MNDELREKMLLVMPHLRFAVEEATKEAAGAGTVEFGILVKNADGSGKVVASFRAIEFIEDLATLLGAGPLTDEERMDARALKLVTKFGLR